MGINIILILIGIFLLVTGADLMIKGAHNVAKKFHISEMLIGIIIMGIGTSLPEIIITIRSSINSQTDIIIGNAIGSAICNLLFVIGIASACRPLKIDKRLTNVHLPISILAIIILFTVTNFFDTGNIINKIEGATLLILTVIYMIYSAYEGKNENEENEKQLQKEIEEDKIKNKKINDIKIIFYIIIGAIFLKYGADLVVDKATEIAELYGISEFVISMTIIAIGTALPEIITSIIATIKREPDLAIGNVIGSNIYNLILLPGLGAIIKPMEYSVSYNQTLIFLLVATIYVTILGKIGKKNVLTRLKGLTLIIIYLIYMSSILM